MAACAACVVLSAFALDSFGTRLVCRRRGPAALDDRWRLADISLGWLNVPVGQCRPFTLAGFVIFYSVLAVVELYLMVRTISDADRKICCPFCIIASAKPTVAVQVFGSEGSFHMPELL